MNAPTAHSFPLADCRVVIGRDHGCGVVISGIGVSRRHARITREGGGAVIADLGSTCGTLVDGKLLRGGDNTAALTNGSAVTVGTHVMQVYIEDDHVNVVILNPSGAGDPAENDDDENDGKNANARAKILRVGRGTDNDVCLPHPMVSRYHAVVRLARGSLAITDLGSTNSTYVNGVPVGSAALREGDAVHIGPFRFFVKGTRFCRAEEITSARDMPAFNKIKIEARALGLCVGGKKLLDGVDLAIDPGAFVALLGGSGAGKSLLAKVLSGELRPTSGRLFLNGFPASKFGAAFTRSIGYVSQQILLRQELTVWETLFEQSLIRLPSDSAESERLDRAREILELMELGGQRHRRVADLSGGEARRLHVGVELLASPAALILDEPLAGLDPGLVVKFMRLFRAIADKGHALILITHNLEEIELCDKAAYIKSGRTLFSGTPSEMRAHFGVTELADIFQSTTSASADTSSSSLTTSSSVSMTPPPPLPPIRASKKPPRHQRAALTSPTSAWITFRRPLAALMLILRQSIALTKRYAKVYVRDRRNIALLMAQTPVIALLLGFVYKTSILQFPASFYFCLAVTGIWVGGLDSAREVAAELPLLAREAKCGLRRIAYVAARLVTAAALSVVQALTFAVAAVVVFAHLDFTMELLLLLAASIFAGNILGLAVSAASGGVGRAISALPIVLIPQIFFSGILVPFEQMSEIGRVISRLTVSRPLFAIFRRVFMLDQPAVWHAEWTELFILCAILITIFAASLMHRTGRRG